MLTEAQIAAIEEAVDDMYDRARSRFLGPQSVNRILSIEYSRPLSLPGMVEAVSNHTGVLPNMDSLAALVRTASNYIEASRARSKAQVVHAVDSFIRNSRRKKNNPDDVVTVLGGELAELWAQITADVRRIFDTEMQRAKNITLAEGIVKVNEAAGVADPVMYFVVVRDGALCDECRELHLQPDGVTPRVWKMSEIEHGHHVKGSGHPSIAGNHPHCRCVCATILPGFGFTPSGMVTWIREGYSELEAQRGVSKSEPLKKHGPEGEDLFKRVVVPHVTQNHTPHAPVPDTTSLPEHNRKIFEHIHNSPIAIHFPGKTISKGFFKQMENDQLPFFLNTGATGLPSGWSMGLGNEGGIRQKAEKQLFGVPTETEWDKRPIYGAIHIGHAGAMKGMGHNYHLLSAGSVPLGVNGPARGYGGIYAILHDHVKSRATVSSGDSFDSLDKTPINPIGLASDPKHMLAVASHFLSGARDDDYSPLGDKWHSSSAKPNPAFDAWMGVAPLKPTVRGMPGAGSYDPDKLLTSFHGGYIESQIWGGVGMRDVKEFHLTHGIKPQDEEDAMDLVRGLRKYHGVNIPLYKHSLASTREGVVTGLHKVEVFKPWEQDKWQPHVTP